ncbi:MAG: PLDc N-terminal domain-containing protein [Nanoarchaeota archaeon]|nr:PLDc N-terminal domain-containing protein [Nanoarchaeota archaeon]
MAMGWGELVFGSIFAALIFIAIGIFSLVFWIMMLVDSIQRKFKKSDERIIWVIVIVLTGVIGALIYYFVVKKKAKK